MNLEISIPLKSLTLAMYGDTIASQDIYNVYGPQGPMLYILGIFSLGLHLYPIVVHGIVLSEFICSQRQENKIKSDLLTGGGVKAN